MEMPLQLSVCFAERNDALNCAAYVENPNLAGAKACPTVCIAERVSLTSEHRLDARPFKALPAVPEWSDFGDRHRNNCTLLKSTVSVRLNMSESNNDKTLSTTKNTGPRYTGERLLRERPKIYR